MSEQEVSNDEIENFLGNSLDYIISESDEDELLNSKENLKTIPDSDEETCPNINLSKSVFLGCNFTSDEESDIEIPRCSNKSQHNIKGTVKIASSSFDAENESKDGIDTAFMKVQGKKTPIISDDSDGEDIHAFKKRQFKKIAIISDDTDSEENVSIPILSNLKAETAIFPNTTTDSHIKSKNNSNLNDEDAVTGEFKKDQVKKTPISSINTDSEEKVSAAFEGNLKVRTDIFPNTTNGSHITSKNNADSINDEVDYVAKNISDEDITNISSEFKKSRISDEFSFGKNKKLLSSTFIDSKTSTPKNSVTGKRLLNKSVDTPKVFKQIKEIDTPRKIKQIILSSSDDSDKANEEDIIDLSSGEESSDPIKIVKQPTLLQLMKKEIPHEDNQIKEEKYIEVSQTDYEEQRTKIRQLQSDFQKSSELIRKINLEHLPDKGLSLQNRVTFLEQAHLAEVKKLSIMKITKQNNPTAALSNPQSKILSWKNIEEGASNVLPRTFGKQALATINTERQLTVDRLQQLHGSLQTCPKETDLAQPPKGLKVELMTHQKRALAWLMWREKQKPSGGILADDMGLGKTLTMISLMLKCNVEKKDDSESDEDEENSPRKRSKFNGGTLVVCPASLINQWSGELDRRTKRGLASCEVYHGPKRETKPSRLANYDMVVTTYSIVNNECEKNGAIFRVNWRRIIIDEAHQIRNHKSQTSEAVCKLPGKSRWALTGTPVHNKELDMYALMKFLRCSPFDDLKVWKRWVGDKSSGGTDRLHTVISSLMLRRTKSELIEKGILNAMPQRKWELIQVDLTERERGVYSKILIFSRTLFAQFLHQRAEKNQDDLDSNCNINANVPNQEYFSMRQKLLKLNKLRDIKQHEILVLLLRLRQICNHPSLITSMLEDEGNIELLGNDEEESDSVSAINLLEQLNKLTLTDEYNAENANLDKGIGEEAMSLKEVAKTVLSPSDPIFSKTRMSSKINVLIKLLKENVIERGDKAVIVSQWSSFLRLIAYHLKEEDLIFDQLDGQVPVHKRMDMVDRLNNPKDKMRILLLSLTAGGVGLNLVGANHLILLDLHWNPQLENQAQDRIYRVGQEKQVFVYKLMATDTIEKRILDLQEKKLEMANSMLTGSSHANKNKLTLQDLKMLFEM